MTDRQDDDLSAALARLVLVGIDRLRADARRGLADARDSGAPATVGTGRPVERHPEDGRALGWREIESVTDEVRALGRRALPVVSDAYGL